MKRKTTSSLLAVSAAIAGVALGSSLALAAHQAIPLLTYEEVAQQYGMGNVMPVMSQNHNGNQGMPYSPKQTCSGGDNAACHGGYKGYDNLSKHAFHSALGWNEWMDNDPSGLFISPTDHKVAGVDINTGVQTGLNPQKPWLQSHGHNGKW